MTGSIFLVIGLSTLLFEGVYQTGRWPTSIYPLWLRFGVTFLITLYFQLAHVMVALDLETEEPFVGWALENAG